MRNVVSGQRAITPATTPANCGMPCQRFIVPTKPTTTPERPSFDRTGACACKATSNERGSIALCDTVMSAAATPQALQEQALCVRDGDDVVRRPQRPASQPGGDASQVQAEVLRPRLRVRRVSLRGSAAIVGRRETNRAGKAEQRVALVQQVRPELADGAVEAAPRRPGCRRSAAARRRPEARSA
jgi:hypothetical protein